MDLETQFQALAELQRHREDIPVYHWSPTKHRRQINKLGLVTHHKPTIIEEWRAPYICFADSPSQAWALSGRMNWAPIGEWDLWQTWKSALNDPEILPDSDRPSGIYEIRTFSRVYKRNLWYVGTRLKEGNHGNSINK